MVYPGPRRHNSAMGLNGFLFNFAAQGWMISMTAIGGLVLMAALAIRVLRPAIPPGLDKPNFSGFALAVIVNPVGLLLLSRASDTERWVADLITLASVTTGIGCLLLSMKRLTGRDDPASRFLRRSTWVLLVCGGAALMCMIAGVAGELQTWKS